MKVNNKSILNTDYNVIQSYIHSMDEQKKKNDLLTILKKNDFIEV